MFTALAPECPSTTTARNPLLNGVHNARQWDENLRWYWRVLPLLEPDNGRVTRSKVQQKWPSLFRHLWRFVFLKHFFLKCDEDHPLIFTVENPNMNQICISPIHIKHDIWYPHQQRYHTWIPCNFECFSSIPSAWGWSSKWRKSFQVLGKPKVFTTSELRINGLQQMEKFHDKTIQKRPTCIVYNIHYTYNLKYIPRIGR